LGLYILENHLINDKHLLFEVRWSEKIELFIAFPKGYDSLPDVAPAFTSILL